MGSGKDSDILVLSPSVEGDHFTIAIKEGSLWITDHNTKFGTFIDDEKVQSNIPTQAPLGAFLRAGKSSLLIKVDTQDQGEQILVTNRKNRDPEPEALTTEEEATPEDKHQKNLKKLQIEIEIENIEEKKIELLHDLEDIKVQQKESEIKIRHLESEAEQKRNEIDVELKKLTELKLEANEFEETIRRKKELDQEISELQKQRSEVLNEITEVQRDVYNQNTEINSTITEKKLLISELEGEKNLIELAKNELRDQIDELKIEKSKIIAEIEEIKDKSITNIEELRDNKRMSNEAQKSRERLERELSNINSTKHSVQQELEQKKQELNQLEREVADAKKESTDIAKNIFDKKQEFKNLEEEINQSKVEQTRIGRELVKNRSHLEESEIEILRLSNYIQQLEEDQENILSERDTCKKDLIKLNTEKEQVRMKLESIQADIHKSHQLTLEAEKEYRSLLEKKNRLSSDLSESEIELKELTDEKVSLKKAINNFGIERDKQLDELNRLKREEEQLSSRIGSLKDSKEDLERTTKSLGQSLDANKEELAVVKTELQNSLKRNDELKEEIRTAKGEVEHARDQLLSLEEGIKKNHKIAADSEKEKQKMLAEKSAVEFDLQSLISKHAHLEQSMEEMGKEKERKFEEMTQFKLRAEKDLEIMRSQTAEKKREFQAFTNDIEILEKKQIALKRAIEDLDRDKKHAAEEHKRHKSSLIDELQEVRNKINAERKQLKDHEFQAQKAKEARGQVELKFADVQNQMKHLQHKIDNFESERDEQLKKLGELKAKAEQEIASRRKMQLDKLERDMNNRRSELEVEYNKRKEQVETELDELEQNKLLELEDELKKRDQQFEDQKILQLDEFAERIGDLLNFELDKANSESRKVVPIDVKTVIRDIFAHKSSHQVTKKALLIYKLKSNQKMAIALALAIIIAIVTVVYALVGQSAI